MKNKDLLEKQFRQFLQAGKGPLPNEWECFLAGARAQEKIDTAALNRLARESERVTKRGKSDFDGCPRGKAEANDWITYLKQSGHYENYDGACNCLVCKRIQQGFVKWNKQPNHRKAD